MTALATATPTPTVITTDIHAGVSQSSTAVGHEYCTERNCQPLLALLGNFKASMSRRGVEAEKKLAQKLRRDGYRNTVHAPVLPLLRSIDGGLVKPDLALLSGILGTRTMKAFLKGTGSATTPALGVGVDALIEVKIQDVNGTCDEKISRTIDTGAHLSDVHQMPYVIIHLLCPKAVRQGRIDRLADEARDAGIGFLSADGLTPALLNDEITRLLAERAANDITGAVDALTDGTFTINELLTAGRVLVRRRLMQRHTA